MIRKPQRAAPPQPAPAPIVAWAIAILAPLLVTAALVELRSVLAVLLIYQVGLGLVWSLLVTRWLGRRSWREHLRRLGLTGPATRRGVAMGLGLGILFAAAPVGRWLLWPEWSPSAGQLGAVLRGWGVDPASPGPILAILAVINGPAEEILWRGHLQDRLLSGRARFWPRALVLCVLFTSYHVFTIGRLAPSPVSTVGRLVAVFAGAIFWTWSRRRWNSLWPALLTHTGVSVGYVWVAGRLLHHG